VVILIPRVKINLPRLKLDCKALLCLAIARLLVLCPTRLWLKFLGWSVVPFGVSREVCGELQSRVAFAAESVRIISRKVPWRADCLPQAVALLLLVGPARGSCEIVLGAAKGVSGEMSAHAWVRVGSQVVLGRNEISRFQPVALLVAGGVEGRS